MQRPFEVSLEHLQDHLDEMVEATFRDLQSQFLLVPKGTNFVEYPQFQQAYEVLKSQTNSFSDFTESTVWAGLRQNALTFIVLRTILGLSPPEWADLVKSEIPPEQFSELGRGIPQGTARELDSRCRTEINYFDRLATSTGSLNKKRVEALVSVAVNCIGRGAPSVTTDTLHRLGKVDTSDGLTSIRHVASHHVPYAMLLYERFLGRPFASHRDSVSELVGDVMESAIEQHLFNARITFRKTKRAERIPGFEQAPDFFIPDEYSPAIIIEAKITGDDGTARDKATRIVNLAKMRDERVQKGLPEFEVIACIDGRGFGVRREDMKRMLVMTRGKVFTLSTLDKLVSCTRIKEYLPKS